MGYRSDVRCLIYGSPEHMTTFIARYKLSDGLALDLNKDDIKQYQARYDETVLDVIDLKYESVKWYDSYPDVTAWMGLLSYIDDMLAEEDEPHESIGSICYEFIRTGEEVGDIEYKHTDKGYGFLYTETSITVSDYLTKIEGPTP